MPTESPSDSSTDTETVYVRGWSHSGGRTRAFHTDRECPRLQSARTVMEKDRAVLAADADECQFCAGTVDDGSDQDHSRHQALAEMDADDLVTDGGRDTDETDGTERTECWRCGYERPIFESCPECGESCKPLTKRKQRSDDAEMER